MTKTYTFHIHDRIAMLVTDLEVLVEADDIETGRETALEVGGQVAKDIDPAVERDHLQAKFKRVRVANE